MTQSVRKSSWLTSIATASALFLQPLAARSEGWRPPVEPFTTQSPLQWSTSQREGEDSKQRGVTWSSSNIAPGKETTSETPTRSLVWQPLEPGDVITEDDIIPLSDLEKEPIVSVETLKAYARGSMVQLGETVYPNIGMNALQRAPETRVELGITAIDDSWQWFGAANKPDECGQGNFFSSCADGLMENRVRIWNSPAFSADLVWTIHSLSGEGAPFSFTVGNNTYGDGDGGTKFGDGQSLGFRVAKNFGNTFGISIGGSRLWHFDDTTDLSKPLYVRATKIFTLNDSEEPPIISLTLGLMTDVYNPDTNIGTVQYPDWLLGGKYPSLFAERYDKDKRRNSTGGTFYPNVAGVSSPFVCAEETIFSGKQPTDKNKDCIKRVAIAPIGSVGFAPWPWLGFYANFTRNLNLGISLKPFKKINWNISAHIISSIVGLNSQQDRSIKRNRCPDDYESFSACRTRIGLWTEYSF
ncbi:hypothetical protein SynBOUM118_00442 [Synechococcus sp. BOUM118]|nr:hypothetical protein SynBOUM118_00442 [Synechococcus sp. BOUM118]